jgi:hypothetical protein
MSVEQIQPEQQSTNVVNQTKCKYAYLWENKYISIPVGAVAAAIVGYAGYNLYKKFST